MKFAEPGIASGAQRDDQEQRGEHGRTDRDAAHVADVLAAARALGEQRDDEIAGDDEPVVDGLEQRAVAPRR